MGREYYTPSTVWCDGCDEFRAGNYCKNPKAVKYGRRLGVTKNMSPCWFIRGTQYCKKDEDGNMKQE